MVALALAVLAEATTAPAEAVRLALEVREPGTPHRARRAIELAELVLEHTAERDAAKEESR